MTYADFFPTHIQELLSIPALVWPTLAGESVLAESQIDRENVVNAIRGGRIQLPFAVVDIGSMTWDPDQGPGNAIYRHRVTFWWLDKQGDRTITNQQAVQAQLWSLADYIQSNTFSTFQVDERPDFNTAADEAFNSRVLEGGIQLYGGSVTWPTGLLTGWTLP